MTHKEQEKNMISQTTTENNLEDEIALIREDLSDQLKTVGGECADRLYERIHQLSTKIQNEMGTNCSAGGGDASWGGGGGGGGRGVACDESGLSEEGKLREKNKSRSGVTKGVVKDMRDVSIEEDLEGSDPKIVYCIPNSPAPCTSHSSYSIETEEREEKEEEEEEEKVQFDDPKTQKAYEKMLRLDERLAEAGRKEAAVKRQRKMLEKEMEKKGITWPSNMPASKKPGLIS